MKHCCAFLTLGLTALAWLATEASTRAQWLTQDLPLKAGWTAVYLHVDSSYATLDTIVGGDAANPIQEIWLWQPAPGTDQFVTNPQLPTGSGTQWSSWNRNLGPSSQLHRLNGNVACLVRLPAAAAPYTWHLKGKPVPPHYNWTSSGLNFIGFPTVPVSPPTYETFLTPQPELLQSGEIYRYVGGDLGPGNPARLFAYRTTVLPRGEAIWIRAGQFFNRYFGPFELGLQNNNGAHFNDSLGQFRIRLKNLFPSPIDVKVVLLPSETPPAGQTAIIGVPPVVVRGELDLATLSYGMSELNGTNATVQLDSRDSAGAEKDLVIGIDRVTLGGGPPGSVLGGILRFTDSRGLTQVDVPLSVVIGSTSGLWVGDATVSQVRHYLLNYQRDTDGAPVMDANGRYKVSSTNLNLGSVARSMRLRLIVHNNQDTGAANLLQRVYYGMSPQGTNIIATRQSLLDATQLANARRITAVHLPFTPNNDPIPMSGLVELDSYLSATVSEAYSDQISNPFLHTYHPDHDNLDATFSQYLPQGDESWTITREISLSFVLPPPDFSNRTTGSEILSGAYQEYIFLLGKGSELRRYDVAGTFILNRISSIPVLTQ